MSRHPYNGLGQDTRERDGTQGRYFDSLRHPTIRPTRIVRPIAQGGVATFIGYDQQGYIDEANPAQAASPAGANNSAFASGSAVARRLYYRFATRPLSRPSLTEIQWLGGIEASDLYYERGGIGFGQLQAKFITEDFDLESVTWNSEASSPLSTMTNAAKIVEIGMNNTSSPFRWDPLGVVEFGFFATGSTEDTYGIIIQWQSDTSFPSGREGHCLAFPDLRVLE